MADLSYAQLKGVWLTAAKGTKYATNAWASLMAAIAEAESGGNPQAVNPTDNNGTQTSWGLWQISNGTHSQVSSSWADPTENARLAIQKLDSQGLDAWGTYTSGAYRGFLSDKTTADTSGIGATDAVTTAAVTTAANVQADCAWNLELPLTGNVCLLSRSQLRGIVGVNLILGGAIVIGVGLAWIVKGAAIGLLSEALLPVLTKVAAPATAVFPKAKTEPTKSDVTTAA